APELAAARRRAADRRGACLRRDQRPRARHDLRALLRLQPGHGRPRPGSAGPARVPRGRDRRLDRADVRARDRPRVRAGARGAGGARPPPARLGPAGRRGRPGRRARPGALPLRTDLLLAIPGDRAAAVRPSGRPGAAALPRAGDRRAPMIALEGLTFTYPGASAPALHDVWQRVEAGALALVVGPSGAGKSTLLRCLNGLVPHFSGGRPGGP